MALVEVALRAGTLDALPEDMVPEGWTPWYLSALGQWQAAHAPLLRERQAEQRRREVVARYNAGVHALAEGFGAVSAAARAASGSIQAFAAAAARAGLGTETQARLAHGLAAAKRRAQGAG